MAIVGFVWDASNIEHLGRHKIKPLEAEEAILLDCLEADVQRYSGESRVLCFGRTARGRLLTIIYTVRGNAIRVVTGYPMTRRQQRLYFEEK